MKVNRLLSTDPHVGCFLCASAVLKPIYKDIMFMIITHTRLSRFHLHPFNLWWLQTKLPSAQFHLGRGLDPPLLLCLLLPPLVCVTACVDLVAGHMCTYADMQSVEGACQSPEHRRSPSRVAGSTVTNLFLAVGDMQGMKRRWQLSVLIMVNEAQAYPPCVGVCVCVRYTCLHTLQYSQGSFPRNQYLSTGHTHTHTTHTSPHTTSLNYLPTLEIGRGDKVATLPSTIDLQGEHSQGSSMDRLTHQNLKEKKKREFTTVIKHKTEIRTDKNNSVTVTCKICFMGREVFENT